MDFNLKEWRNESEQHDDGDPPSAKLPRLVFNSHPHHPSAVPLFLSQSNTNLSAFSSDHSTNTTPAATKFPRMGSYFSLSQWQELELQALIFRHMLAGADVPPELVSIVQKSLIASTHHPLHHHFPHYQPALLQSAYWGRAAMDPEPGRCRRTDGKKWRCSRDVVAGQKYCERHMHRGKNRSRKPVEIAGSTTSPYGGGGDALKTNNSITRQGVAGGGGAPQFSLSVPSHSTDLHLNQRPPDSIIDPKGSSEARTIRHFFDDRSKPIHDMDNASNYAASATDFSLKLGTGDGAEAGVGVAGGERDRPQLNWEVTWGANPVGLMGGPLAEALRASMSSSSSPTSVLHRLSRGPPSEASYVSY